MSIMTRYGMMDISPKNKQGGHMTFNLWIPLKTLKGCPYTPISKDDFNEDGTPKWEIKKVFYKGLFDMPHKGHSNSPYSVKSINQGRVPWLNTNEYNKACKQIYAGITLAGFVIAVKEAGGEVYDIK